MPSIGKFEQLLQAVEDRKLRVQFEKALAELKDRTRFGLVYERHLPETVIVGDVEPLEVGDHVRPKEKVDEDHDYRVQAIKGKKARIVSLTTETETDVAICDLLVVKRFGDPAYVSLEPIDSIRRSSERPYHAVVNGENFHVLQALVLIYERQVDCIYIDPPYNSGASDWKYNNRFVDINDTYSHSKWLSFMEKRLRLAKRLLKPDGVLVVTIDENEVNHLGLLLEEIFPAYQRTMVTIVINPKGTARANFARVEEYAYFVIPDTGEDVVAHLPGGLDQPEYVPEDVNLKADDDENEADNGVAASAEGDEVEIVVSSDGLGRAFPRESQSCR